MTKKMGRPKLAKGEAREGFISTRVSSSEAKEIAGAITRSGQAKTEWVRNTLLTAARNRDTKSH
jgi:hypothetical protein